MINSVNIAGNLTRDVELKQSKSGANILSFGIAVNERIKNQQSGEWTDRPNFFSCVCFGKRAESLSKMLHKGQKVAVSGHLRQNQWENNRGEKRSNVEIVIDDIEFMSQRNNQQQPNNYTSQGQYGPQNGSQGFSGGYQQQAYQQPPMDVYSSDMPFR